MRNAQAKYFKVLLPYLMSGVLCIEDKHLQWKINENKSYSYTVNPNVN